MSAIFRLGFLAATLAGVAFGAWAAERGSAARTGQPGTIRYLPPASFPRLPKRVARELERRGCRVPQAFVSDRPHNVISGAFLGPHERDWAVLCSRAARSAILVFDPRHAQPMETINESDDRAFLQNIGGGTLGFSRVINVADRAYILEHDGRYGNDQPSPPIDHDGIDDAFAEKASIIMYRHRGAWRRLTGAD